jgi:type III pantothenate kinase
MNLTLDIGNSNFKMAVFDGKTKVASAKLNSDLDREDFEKNISGFVLDKAIISSVSVIPEFVTEILSSRNILIHTLSYKSILPFEIHYKTPETLGSDRIANLAGAFNIFPNEDILIIDAGTAITYDFLRKGVYKGGNISPGINIRLKALHSFTDKLPLASVKENFDSPGQTTHDAILSGVINGVIYEINEYIRAFKKEHKNNKIILTGGNSEYLSAKLNNQIMSIPDLVNEGLNFILEHNA